MEQQRAPRLADLDKMLERFGEVLKSIPPDKLLLKREDVRIQIGDNPNSYVEFTLPLGDTIARFSDMVAEGRPFSEIIAFLFARCLKAYRIEAGSEVLDSNKVPADKRVETFVRRVSPAILSYTLLAFLKYMRDNQLGGIDFGALAPPTTATEEEIEVIEIDEE
ncbi:MAG: hypothetical protein QXT00_02715 [Ignisphaera sp.]